MSPIWWDVAINCCVPEISCSTVLKLETLIEIKRQLHRPKDKLMLMHLEAALDEREKLRRGST
jgi:hypothetical protein